MKHVDIYTDGACRYRELETAEQRVKVLQEMQNGDIEAVPFDTDLT